MYAAAFLFVVTLGAVLLVVAAVTLLRKGHALAAEARQEVPSPASGPPVGRHGGPAADGSSRSRQRTIWFGYLEAQVPEIAMNGLIGGAIFAVLATQLMFLHPVRKALGDGNKAGLAGSVLLILGFALVGVLASEQRSASTRRTVGVLWDVATFWPRVGHPFSPPSYGERTVPELRERMRWLVEQGSEVVLTSYSQGTVIAVAALMQLPTQVRDHISLVTLGCPVRRLYGRGFPFCFGFDQVHDLMRLPLRRGHVGPPWVNVWRSTDYVGGWVMRPGVQPGLLTSTCRDVWICDPNSFGRPPGDQSFPVVNKHLEYFPDAKVAEQMLVVLNERGYRGR